MLFRIKNENGTYFRQMTAIGPCFGETFETAKTFEDGMEAHFLMSRNFGLVAGSTSFLVNEQDVKCTVTGEPIQ
jgi:hypothetical protein